MTISMKVGFTVKELAAKVRELATARPEHIYEKGLQAQCTYLPNPEFGAPEGCIVGQAALALGAPTGILADCMGSVFGLLGELGLSAATNSGDNFDNWTRKVQARQDCGETWGDALAYADRMYPAVASELSALAPSQQ